MTDKIKWGIIGTGFISRQFAIGLSVLPEAELVAVGSRTAESANNFGDVFNVPHRHTSYEALANDPDVDVVYIGTPHTLHQANMLLCLEAGKAVLCEKPFAINVTQAQSMIDLARQKKLFLMEAMWTRYFPLVVEIRKRLTEGIIGELQMVSADLGIKMEYNPEGRLFNPNLGGGALLDLGVYAISWAYALFGPPDRVTSLAQFGETGVDELAGMVFGYDQGRLATLYTSILNHTPQEVIIMGSEGRLRIHSPMFHPTRCTISKIDQPDELLEIPYHGNGYNYQAAEVMRCLRAGLLESETMPLDESLAIMQTMDQIRAQWGFKYPME